MKISTWNVNGVRAREAQVLDFLAVERPDVLCLQEIKASPADVPQRLREVPGYVAYWHGHKGYSGVAVYVLRASFPVAPVFTHPELDEEHRVVTVELGDLVIASIYVPNGNKDLPAKVRFLEALERWVADAHARGRRLILCGDLNVALEDRDVHPKLRKPEQIGQTAPERALLARILAAGLVDLLRRAHPDDDELFTWWAPWRNLRARNVGWRLDYVLVSESLAPRATGCRAARDFGTSDHGPVTAELEGPLVEVAAAHTALAEQAPAQQGAAEQPSARQLSLFEPPPRR